MISAVHRKPKFYFQYSLYHSVRYAENKNKKNKKSEIKRYIRTVKLKLELTVLQQLKGNKKKSSKYI
jgi:hypothetical protein